ncbi:hypothetical protein IW140_005210 [Coemansia sp. RSA 1813]|nr:hypothetical protein LPJ74_004662 [Coemansia sp. RSA 1843]KAJ2214997.1 hypothetical protein EV179_002527 [Coemansia sp. RSA 487]KAJ2565746.1 hypothetical protein IW140_005210 [Coemansia sp. RSA 1813]
MSMSPGPATTNHQRKADSQSLARSTTPATDASSAGGDGSSRGTSAEPSGHSATPGSKAGAPSKPQHKKNHIQNTATTQRPKPLTPRPDGEKLPAQTSSPGSTQLLRKISVAGITVEVVRQESRIIYRLPGNMPVSSLTPEQRTQVMDEIQRMRNSGATTPTNGTRAPPAAQQPGHPSSQNSKLGIPSIRSSPRPVAAKQGNFQPRTPIQKQDSLQTYSRPRPALLPSIAPRPLDADGETTVPQSAPLPGSLGSPGPSLGSGLSRQQQQQAIQSRPLSATTLSKSQQQKQRSASPSPVATQKSALERMYQSAYLKLLSGPAEVLRKLNPPVELSMVLKNNSTGTVGTSDRSAAAPEMLLQILKSLTKGQASQLANMYDRELRAGRNSLEISTSGLRGLATVSQPQSRESSPVAGSVSGTEFDESADPLGSGSLTPTKKRKVGRLARPLSKKRSVSTSEPPTGSASPVNGDKLAAAKTMSYAHVDMIRHAPPPLAERRKRPTQTKHETEIGKRFREALAMDHQMVRSPDWRTPFSGTRDIVQRLLPFHVFQYPDVAVDSAIRQVEDRISRSTNTLEKRLGNISTRFNAILEGEASEENFYRVDNIQMEINRIYDATKVYAQLEEAKMEHCMSLAGSSIAKHS